MRTLLALVGHQVDLYRRLGFRPREAVAAACLYLDEADRRRAVDALVGLGWVRPGDDCALVLAGLADNPMHPPRG